MNGDTVRHVAANTVVRRSERVVHRDLADGAGGVLLHLDTAAYHGVNPVGSLVWELLETPTTVEDLLAGLRARFDAVPLSFEVEIAKFLDELRGRGLVEFVE